MARAAWAEGSGGSSNIAQMDGCNTKQTKARPTGREDAQNLSTWHRACITMECSDPARTATESICASKVGAESTAAASPWADCAAMRLEGFRGAAQACQHPGHATPHDSKSSHPSGCPIVHRLLLDQQKGIRPN